MPTKHETPRRIDDRRQRWGLVLGPVVCGAMLAAPAPEGLSVTGWHTAAVGLLMAIWWVSEALPIPVTALLPLVLFPLLGVAPIAATAAPYANPVIFLFLGGFVLAAGLERSGLHRRLALGIIRLVGTRPPRLVAGFMVATAFISMWVSNTATAAMMLPMALSVLALVKRENDPLAPALLLGIAYGANIGGMGTLIGTPPNALLAGFLAESEGFELGFAAWLAIGIPVVLVSLTIVWMLLTRVLHRLDDEEIAGGRETIRRQIESLGRASRRERSVGVIAAVVATAWVLRPLLGRWIPGISDAGIAITGAVLLFVVPVAWRPLEAILEWRDADRVPWGLLVLFGGGLSLASAIQQTGLAPWLGELLMGLEAIPTLALVAVVTTLIIFLTELASNTATTAAFLPVAASIAVAVGADVLTLAVPVALAASCAFMMPVATPPNAIVFGSGRLTIPQMAKAGFWVNLVMIVVVTAAAQILVPLLSP